MSSEVLRDLDVRRRGLAFEGWLEGASSVEVEVLDTSLLGAACALPVLRAVRALGLPVTLPGDSLGESWLRLAIGADATWRVATRRLVLDPERRFAKLDRSRGELRVPCARARHAGEHPMVRWMRGALASGLPAERQVPRVELGWRARHQARRELRARGVRTPVALLAPATGSKDVATVRSTLERLSYRVMSAGEVTPSALAATLARATLATVVIGDDAGLLHAAAACGAHVIAVGQETLAPPYPATTWVRTPTVELLSAELQRLSVERFPWDALGLHLP